MLLLVVVEKDKTFKVIEEKEKKVVLFLFFLV